jgi:hypothetical protein
MIRKQHTRDDLKSILNPRLKAKFTPHLLTYQRTDLTELENDDDEDPPNNPDPPNDQDPPNEPDSPNEPDPPNKPDLPKEPDPPKEPDAPTAPDPSLKNKIIYLQFGNNGSYQAKLTQTGLKSIKTKKRKPPKEWNEGDFLGLEDQRFMFRIGATDADWLAGTMKLVEEEKTEEKTEEKPTKPTKKRKTKN